MRLSEFSSCDPAGLLQECLGPFGPGVSPECPRECPRKWGVSEGVSDGVSRPRAPECPTLFGHPVGHSLGHPLETVFRYRLLYSGRTKRGIHHKRGIHQKAKFPPILGHFIQWFLRAISTNRPYHGYPFCGDPFGPSWYMRLFRAGGPLRLLEDTFWDLGGKDSLVWGALARALLCIATRLSSIVNPRLP